MKQCNDKPNTVAIKHTHEEQVNLNHVFTIGVGNNKQNAIFDRHEAEGNSLTCKETKTDAFKYDNESKQNNTQWAKTLGYFKDCKRINEENRQNH